jgi:hypothetical protein
VVVAAADLRLVLLALLAAAGSALALLTFAGRTPTVGPEAVAQAAERTSDVEGLRFSLTGEMNVPTAGSVSFTGAGVSDLRNERGTVTMDMSDLARKGAAAAAPVNGDWTMEMVFDRRSLYMKWGLLSPGLGGKSWMKLDLERLAEAAGIDSGLLRAEQQQGGDPASTLRYLRAASEEVEELGTADVRGVESTHYRTTVDLRRYPDLVPPDRREPARRSIERIIEQTGSDTLDVEVWVGQDQLVRRVKWAQSIRPPAAGEAVEAAFTCDFYDFGTPVTVDVPPEADVKDLTEEVTAPMVAGGQAP